MSVALSVRSHQNGSASGPFSIKARRTHTFTSHVSHELYTSIIKFFL